MTDPAIDPETPPATEAATPPPGTPTPAVEQLVPAPALGRLGAWLFDLLLLIACAAPAVAAGVSRLDRLTDPGRPKLIPDRLALAFGAATVLLCLVQWGLQARTGATLGARLAGIRVARVGTSAPAGFFRGLLLRRWVPTALLSVGIALGLASLASSGLEAFSKMGTRPTLLGERPPFWLQTVRLLPAGFVLFSIVDAVVALFGRRTLGGRLSGTWVIPHGSQLRRAFEPPRFSGVAFGAAFLGVALSAILAGLVGVWLASRPAFESTDLDIPSTVAAVVAVLGFLGAGAFAAFASRRFVVGELALLALLLATAAFELMATRFVQVPALQRFEIAGWLDWSVYAVGLYFAVVLFLVIGSAIGFMVSSDEGLDVTTKFERLVARRHLRLKLSNLVLLAFIATLLPVLVYGVVIWPVRAAWRLYRGRGVGKTLPPTVFMALLTIVGVMFGVTSLTVVLAVMGGFERDLKAKILGTNAHGVIHRYIGEFDEWEDVARKVRGVEGVQGVTPFILSEVMITTDEAVTGAVLKGIDVDTVGQVTELEKNIHPGEGRLRDLVYPDRIPRGGFGGEPGEEGTEPEAPPGFVEEDDDEVLPGIVIGREMARGLRVWIGDRVTVMNPLGELGPQGPIPRSRVFRVAAIFYSGMYEYDSKFAYILLREAQRFFRLGDSVTGLELRFGNVDEARPLMKRISGVLGGFPYRTKDWGEMNKNLFSALRLERVVMFILLSFQVLIACICVVATLVMLVVEKRKEVATLKAMGAREASIMKLFTIEGLIIGAIGTIYGSTAGYLFCRIADGFRLDPEVYYIERLPVRIDPTSFVAVGVIAMLLVFVATIYPARRGGSIAPVEGFREE